MSTLIQDIPAPAPEDEALGQHIRAQEYLLQRVGVELLNSRLAAAARKIRQAAPGVADVMLAIHPAGGRFSVLEARDPAGQCVGATVRDAAERAIASYRPDDLNTVIGMRINLAEASAWWPGH